VKDCLTRILNDDVIRGPVFSIASIEANLRIFQYNAGIICFSLDTDADEQNDPQFTWELSTRSSKLFGLFTK
jgi:hypothetical protein